MSAIAHISNPQVLITGASQGIGLGFVKHLLQAANEPQVYATYRNPATAQALLALMEQHPQQLTCLEMDITDEAQVAQCAEQLGQKTECLHLVVNCIGLLHDGALQPEKSLKQINPDHLMRYFQVNSIGSVLLAKHLLPLLRHPDPSIFATISAKIGSIGDNRLGGWYGYRASKAALNMLLRTVAIEYGRKSPNTIVAALHPGTTDTRLSQPFQRRVLPEKLFSVDRTVTQLLAVLRQLEPKDSGEFFSWNGDRLPW